jgi:hypothetical protein
MGRWKVAGKIVNFRWWSCVQQTAQKQGSSISYTYPAPLPPHYINARCLWRRRGEEEGTGGWRDVMFNAQEKN